MNKPTLKWAKAIILWIKSHPKLTMLLVIALVVVIVRLNWPHHDATSSDRASLYQTNPYQNNAFNIPVPQQSPEMFVFKRALLLGLCTGIGFAIGAFFSPMFREFRKLILSIVALMVLAFCLFGPFPYADGLNGILSMILFWVGFAFGICLGLKTALTSGKERPTSYGSAKWAPHDYLRDKGLFQETGFLLGNFNDAKGTSPLRYKGDRHLLTVAPTRSGKGVSSITPNLLLHPGSALVIDPKGENALATAHRRGAGTDAITGLKQKIILLDPWNIV